MQMKLLPVVLFFAAMTCASVSSVYFYRLYFEVNSRRPEGKKMSVFTAKLFAFFVIREHSHLVGPSTIRRAMWLWSTASIALFFLFVASVVYLNLK
jgi:hypothetical protein